MFVIKCKGQYLKSKSSRASIRTYKNKKCNCCNSYTIMILHKHYKINYNTKLIKKSIGNI